MRKLFLFLLPVSLLLVDVPVWGETYVKVTQSSDLIVGDTYIFGNADGIATSYASKLPTTNIGCSESEGVITTTTATPMEVILGKDAYGYYNFYVTSTWKYLGQGGSSSFGNDFRNSQTYSNTQECWTISYNSTYRIYTIVNVASSKHIGTGTSSGNDVFALYVSMESYAPVTLYRKATPTTTTITPHITNTDFASGTAAGSLAAEVAVASTGVSIDGATVSWSSDNPDVVTVASDGTVTLVGVGEATITATYVSGTISDVDYASSSDSYDITVYNSSQATDIDVTTDYTWLGVDVTKSLSSFPKVIDCSGVTATISGSGTKTRGDDTYIRMYSGNTLQFAAPSGYMVISVKFTRSTVSGNSWSDPAADVGTYTADSKSWAGCTSSVTYSFSAVTLTFPKKG